MVVDNLLEIAACNIHITQQLALQATIAVRDKQVQQLG
jgi:hypothetical protein